MMIAIIMIAIIDNNSNNRNSKNHLNKKYSHMTNIFMLITTIINKITIRTTLLHRCILDVGVDRCHLGYFDSGYLS